MAKEIPLNDGYTTVVDDADYEWLMQWKWLAGKSKSTSGKLSVYAIRYEHPDGKTIGIYMHRLIMGFPQGLEVDHIDNDKLNNQRFNLRTATKSENVRNSILRSNNKSGYKGVTVLPNGKYRAEIHFNKNKECLGTFDTAEEAHKEYKRRAKMLFGEFFNDGTKGESPDLWRWAAE